MREKGRREREISEWRLKEKGGRGGGRKIERDKLGEGGREQRSERDVDVLGGMKIGSHREEDRGSAKKRKSGGGRKKQRSEKENPGDEGRELQRIRKR